MIRLGRERPSSFSIINVRKWLSKDPGEGNAFAITDSMNSDCLPCQLSLLKHSEAIVECVKHVAWEIFDDHQLKRVWVLYCGAGQHRSDAIAKILASRVFNATVDGWRYFNCNVFSLTLCNFSAVEEMVVSHAERWLEDPWTIRRDDRPWGEDAAAASKDAFDMLKEIDKFGQVIQSKAWEEWGYRRSPSPEGGRSRMQVTLPRPAVVSSDEEDNRARSSGQQARRKRKRPGRGSTPEDRARSSGSRMPAAKRSKVEDDSETCPFCGGTGKKETTPMIDCAEAWMAVLEQQHVDRKARLSWCSLYSASPQGKAEAVSIVHTLLEKGSRVIDHPSAYVQKTTRDKWHAITDPREW